MLFTQLQNYTFFIAFTCSALRCSIPDLGFYIKFRHLKTAYITNTPHWQLNMRGILVLNPQVTVKNYIIIYWVII